MHKTCHKVNFFYLISKFCYLVKVEFYFILGLQPHDNAAMLMVNTIEFFSRKIYMTMKCSFLRREIPLFPVCSLAVCQLHLRISGKYR